MRICLAARLTGGVGIYSQTLVAALLAVAPALHIDLVSPESMAVPMELAERLTLHPAPWMPRLPTHPGWLLDALAFRCAVKRLAADVDVIHFTDARHALFGTGLNRPVVGTMNDYFYAGVTWRPESVSRYYRDWGGRYPLYQLAKAGERRALRRLTRIIAISDAVAEVVAPAYDIPATRFTTVRYGIDFSAIPPNDGALHSPRTILFVGGNFQRKGLLVLLQAMPQVLARHPDTRLTIIGRSHYARGAQRLAARLGILSQCDFLGAVSHDALLSQYAHATVLAMPSLLESFGIPYLEAMSCGLPVVATSCLGPDEYLTNGRNALVVPPGDVAALAEALIQTLGDMELRDRLRAGGIATSREFTPSRMARQTLAVYCSVIGACPDTRLGTSP